MSYGDLEIVNNSKFLKIESGFPHDIRLLSESPTVKVIHGFGKDASICSGSGCLDCQSSDQKIAEPKQRFSADVYNHTLKKKMVWEFGGSIAKQLKKIDITLQEEGQKITSVDLKVESEGQSMQKKYTVTPRRTSKPLPDEIETEIAF